MPGADRTEFIAPAEITVSQRPHQIAGHDVLELVELQVRAANLHTTPRNKVNFSHLPRPAAFNQFCTMSLFLAQLFRRFLLLLIFISFFVAISSVFVTM
jgi:hypothetical protein